MCVIHRQHADVLSVVLPDGTDCLLSPKNKKDEYSRGMYLGKILYTYETVEDVMTNLWRSSQKYYSTTEF
jgi:hypothetical protein